MTLSAGIDVGTGAVKAAIFSVENGKEDWLSRSVLRIRQRDPMELVREAFEETMRQAGVKQDDLHYIATTGEGEAIPFHTGHFYSMTSHARGAIYLNNQSSAVLDCGALHGRAIVTDERGNLVVAGPRSRELLAGLTDADLSNDGFRWLTGREIEVAGVAVRALRVN